MKISCETVQVCENFQRAFEKRVFLVYTGRQRLAKDTLINALRKCSFTLPATIAAQDLNVDNVQLHLANEAKEIFLWMQQNLICATEDLADQKVDKIAYFLNS